MFHQFQELLLFVKVGCLAKKNTFLAICLIEKVIATELIIKVYQEVSIACLIFPKLEAIDVEF